MSLSLLIFGVALPVFTLVLELLSGVCGALSFDPMPTPAHVILVALVPFSNLLTLLRLREEMLTARQATALAWLNALALGVCLYYTLAFAVLLPFSVMALAACGLGLIPLTPAVSLLVALLLRIRLHRRATGTAGAPLDGWPRPWTGIAGVFALILLLATPDITSFVGARLALHPRTHVAGVSFLRQYGPRSRLLALCYRKNRPLAPHVLAVNALETIDRVNLPAWVRPVPWQQARGLYYRVTGTPFNAVAPPQIRGLRGQTIGSVVDASDFDFEQGGDTVSARVRGLSLLASEVDGRVDPAGATGYLEWTLEFRNDSRVQREARATVALPPGGVVSRLTLWVNGEEREAAFAACEQVKSAYRSVVARRRDPVLVTTKGTDRIMVQCFPVPPDGGTMKTRLGITVPLALMSPARGLLRLPYFIERNFSLVPDLLPQARLTGPPGAAWPLETHTLDAPCSVSVDRDPSTERIWAESVSGTDTNTITQSLTYGPAIRPRRAILVVDGSAGMRRFEKEIRQALQALPAPVDWHVLWAGDAVEELKMPSTAWATTALLFRGGCDNVPALVRAAELSSASGTAAILWIHGPQPVALAPLDHLKSDDVPTIHHCALVPGPNVIADALDELGRLKTIASFGNPTEDLRRCFDPIAGGQLHYRMNRSYRGGSAAHDSAASHDPPDDRIGTQVTGESATNLAKLCAYEQILQLLASGLADDHAHALTLAVEHQLVTPVSGAVVLETRQQYEQAGLTPPEDNAPPNASVVPEPEAWALMVSGAVVLFLAGRKRRRLVAC